MELAYTVAAVLTGLGIAAVVLSVYNGVRRIEEHQETILRRLSDIEEGLGDRAAD